MSKRKTNVQLVKHVMENSQYGALSQLFVMDALYKLCDAVAASKPEDYKGSFIHGPSWIGVAKEIQQALKQGDDPEIIKYEVSAGKKCAAKK